jgi:predicted RNA-binding Zn-ribbon protein involved in translation (DUF1610 family)
MQYYQQLAAQFTAENGFEPSDEAELQQFLCYGDPDAKQCVSCAEWIPLDEFTEHPHPNTDIQVYRCPCCEDLESIWVFGRQVYPE